MRNLPHALRPLAVGLALALFASAAIALVATPTAAQVSPADTTTDALGVDASALQDGQDDVEITAQYRRAPEHDEAVVIEMTIHNPDSREALGFSESLSSRTVLEDDTTGFSREGDDYWSVDDDATEPTITFRKEMTSLGPYEYFSSRSAVVDEAYLPVQNDGSGISLDDRSETHVAAEGASAGEYICMGPCEVGTAAADDVTISVIGSTAEMLDSPSAIADALAAAAAEQNEHRAPEHDVTSVAVPEVTGGAGRAGLSNHRVEQDQRIYGEDTWFHEYVHNTDRTESGFEMKWFTEGYAEYGGWLFGMEAGYNDYEDFATAIHGDVDDPVVLADEYAWDDRDDDINYRQGSKVLAAIDRDIRQTPGDETLEDVVAAMHEDDFDGTLDAFVEEVEAVSNDEVGETARTMLTSNDTADLPDPWTYEEHTDTFGGVPRLSTGEATVQFDADSATRTKQFDRFAIATTDERLVVEQRVANDGSAAGHYDPISITTQDGEYERSDGHVTVEPGEESVATATVTFDEPGSYELELEDEQISLTVFESGSQVVHSRGEHATESDAATIHTQTPTLGILAPDSSQEITVTDPDGTEVASQNVITSPQQHLELDPSTLDSGSRYEVTTEFFDGEDTQHVTVLEPVEGSHPRDLNGDGLHRDVNGDGVVSNSDVILFFNNQHTPRMDDYPEAYDLDGDGEVGQSDVIALFESL